MATPYEVLTAFGKRVDETYSVDDVLPRMVRLVADGTGVQGLRACTPWSRFGCGPSGHQEYPTSGLGHPVVVGLVRVSHV